MCLIDAMRLLFATKYFVNGVKKIKQYKEKHSGFIFERKNIKIMQNKYVTKSREKHVTFTHKSIYFVTFSFSGQYVGGN